MADSAILAAGGADAPLSYLVPGAAVIRIKQVHVKYVDNGASGDWLPAVRIVNDAGHTMGTAADQGVKVTSGNDADVSFFPGVKHAAAAQAADSFLRVTFNSAIPSGSIPFGTGTVPTIFAFDTNDPARYTQVGTQHWTMTRGAYIVNGWVSSSTGSPVTTDGAVAWQVQSGSGYLAEVGVGVGMLVVRHSLADLTVGDQGSFTQWFGSLGGTDSHTWALRLNFVYVQGSGPF